MKPLITISSFTNGILSESTLPATNGFSFGAGVDIFSEPGFLKVSQSLDAMTEAATTNDITDGMHWMVKYSGLNKVFGLGSGGSGRIYAYDLGQSSKWALTHDDTNTCWGQGMLEFNGDLFWASNGYLGRMTSDVLAEPLDNSETSIDITDASKFSTTGSIIIDSEIITYTGITTNTLTGCTRGAYGSTPATHDNAATIYGFKDDYKTFTAADTSWHPMVIFGDYLCIGDGKYIATLNSAGTFTATAVDLPAGYRIRSLAVYGNLLYIGTWRGASIYEQPEARLFSCSMTQLTSGEFSDVTILRECGICAMAVWKNLLIVFAGVAGNIYIYNGATLQKFRTLPLVNSIIGEWGDVEPGAVCEYEGHLLFGFSSSVADYAGIYMLSQKDLNDPFVLTSSHIISAADFSNVSIYSLFQASTNVFYVSWSDATNYKVDTINTSIKIASAAYVESQIYTIAPEDNSIEIKGVEIIAKPLATANSIKVEYKKDNASAWSDWGTITSANQSTPLWIAIGLAKTIQVRLEFTTAGGYSPAISQIRIY